MDRAKLYPAEGLDYRTVEGLCCMLEEACRIIREQKAALEMLGIRDEKAERFMMQAEEYCGKAIT